MESLNEVLTGAASLDYLDGLDAALCLTKGKAGIKPTDHEGRPIPGSYLDAAVTHKVAAAHLRQGGGIGLMPHLSNGLTLLDIDAGLSSMFETFPELAEAPRIVRDNAPDRAKLLILVVDQTQKIMRSDAAEPTKKAELLHKGHGNIAGKHPSGEPYKLVTGRLIIFTQCQVQDMLNQWIPEAFSAFSNTPRLSASSLAAPVSSADQIRAAIAWWNNQPANLAEVERLLASCPKRGKYVALRSDDKTPSSTRSDTRDGFYKATWRDHGSSRTLDAYELFTILANVPKASHKWLVVNQWRAAQGLRPLQLA